MEKMVIQASRRTVTGKKVGVLRREGILPGVIYGANIETTPISMDLKEASNILNAATQSHIITIVIDNAEHATLVREKQKDYIRGTLKHIDFQAVSLTEKLRTKVSVEVTGTSPAIKNYNGVVITELDEIEVECLPQDLVDRLIVDVTGLESIGDTIYVRDLTVPEGLTILNDPGEVLVVITSGAEEIVEEEVVEAIAEPEVIERGKKEEEEEE
jgi:large subunit ribosomal protein L25